MAVRDETPHNSEREPQREDTAPHRSPQTDPTNPIRQEGNGEWTQAEIATGRRIDEPGLTDQDRQERTSGSWSSGKES